MNKRIVTGLALATIFLGLGAMRVQAAEQIQEWDLINPSGIVEKTAIDPAKRLTSLDGKTVALRWNSKNNGDVVLNRIAELMAQKFPNTKVIKTYELDKSLNIISGSAAEAERIAKAMSSVKADLVIASQCD